MISSTSGGQDLLKGAPLLKGAGLLAILAFPLLGFSDYVLHIAISILIWGFIYTGWSVMGRFGLVSRSEEHTSELQSLMRISYAVFCLKKKKKIETTTNT